MSNSDPTEIQDDDEREDARQLSLQGNDPPAEIEGYSVIRRLGTGAYGTVWLAREDHTGRMVAIKYYPHRRGLNWSLLSREVEKLATLYASRNIVRLLDVGWNAEPPYYVMEFVENGSLGAYLASGPLGVEETIRIAQEVCGALIEAHGAGVLHCDLKPDNVLLDTQFQIRLCDFGQSRMSHEQSPALGTLYYMAPEQANLDAVPDARWDVYAVGALMFHMLTGEPPYRNTEIQQKLERAESLQDRLQIYQSHIQQAPLPDLHRSVKGVDRHLASVIDQCLAADPKERLPNAQAIRTQLRNRERNRARRPLLLLGVLGPLLLIGAMLPIFVGELNRIIAETEQEQIADEQKKNQMLARSHANTLQGELEYRLRRLEVIVAEDDIVSTLTELMVRPGTEVADEMKQHQAKPIAERPDWMKNLDAAHEAEDNWNIKHGHYKDTSWFLTDANGTQLWRRPFPKPDQKMTVGEDYAWRDYFHGKGEQYDSDQAPPNLSPIQEPYVSVAFKSQATNRYMVALSVPVRSADGKVIGVFARTLHLGELQMRLGRDLHGNSSAVIALADRRQSMLLDHPSLTEKFCEQLSDRQADEMFQQLTLSEADQAAIAAAGEKAGADDAIDIQTATYTDPVSRLNFPIAKDYAGEYIAAMSSLRSSRMPWLVIVQQNRAAALTTVRKMDARAARQAWLAVIVSLGAMLLVWLFVWNALARAKDSKPRRTKLGTHQRTS